MLYNERILVENPEFFYSKIIINNSFSFHVMINDVCVDVSIYLMLHRVDHKSFYQYLSSSKMEQKNKVYDSSIYSCNLILTDMNEIFDFFKNVNSNFKINPS